MSEESSETSYESLRHLHLHLGLAALLGLASGLTINCGQDQQQPTNHTKPISSLPTTNPPVQPGTNLPTPLTNIPAANQPPSTADTSFPNNLRTLSRTIRHNPTGLLVTVNFDQTKIIDADLPALTNTPSLRCLYLYDTAITDAGLKHLHSLTNLALLYLPATQTTPKGLAALRKALPNCTVVIANPSP